MDLDNGTTQHGYRDITVSTGIPRVDELSTRPSGFGVSQTHRKASDKRVHCVVTVTAGVTR